MECLSNYVHASTGFERSWEFAWTGCGDGSGTGNVSPYYFVKIVPYFWLCDIEVVFGETCNVCAKIVHVIEK